jgi:hypothetical protein
MQLRLRQTGQLVRTVDRHLQSRHSYSFRVSPKTVEAAPSTRGDGFGPFGVAVEGSDEEATTGLAMSST